FAGFSVGGIDHKFAVYIANPHCAYRSKKRNVRKGQCAGSSVDSQNVRIVFTVGREHQSNDLGFIAETFRKQRADRTVNQAAGKNFAFAGTSLALDEAARNASAGVGVFTVVHGEREE